jgi:hypothetical protein
MYTSHSPNFPAKVKELIRFSSEGLRVGLFPETTPLSLAFPPQQAVNDGGWHHLAFSWKSIGGEYSLTWDAVRLYAGDGYGTGLAMDLM